MRALPCPKELPYQFSAQTDVWWPSFAPPKMAILALTGGGQQKMAIFIWSPKRHFLRRKCSESGRIVLFRQFWPRTCIFTKKWDSTPKSTSGPRGRQELQKLAKNVDFGVESHFFVKRHVPGQNCLNKTMRPSKKCFVHKKCIFLPKRAKSGFWPIFGLLAKWPF